MRTQVALGQRGGCGERGLWAAAAVQRLRAEPSEGCSLGRLDFQPGYFVINKPDRIHSPGTGAPVRLASGEEAGATSVVPQLNY